MEGGSDKRGEITINILEAVANMATNSVDLFAVLFSAGYGASVSKLEYELSKRIRARENKKSDPKTILRQRYFSMLSHLKRRGFIEGGDKLSITKKGRAKLSALKEWLSRGHAKPRYEKEIGSSFVVVSFDIPEKQRFWRKWISEALSNLGLSRVQQSLWIGKAKIPKEFIDDMYKHKIISFVEIFEVSKTGSIAKI
ncbi:MAG: hypothetical protein Q7S36_00810 [Candidatus Liptonbacteria bacterium]|nr:hypothetical protein [Candidatus Liptonbacteria bacterium]